MVVWANYLHWPDQQSPHRISILSSDGSRLFVSDSMAWAAPGLRGQTFDLVDAVGHAADGKLSQSGCPAIYLAVMDLYLLLRVPSMDRAGKSRTNDGSTEDTKRAPSRKERSQLDLGLKQRLTGF